MSLATVHRYITVSGRLSVRGQQKKSQGMSRAAPLSYYVINPESGILIAKQQLGFRSTFLNSTAWDRVHQLTRSPLHISWFGGFGIAHNYTPCPVCFFVKSSTRTFTCKACLLPFGFPAKCNTPDSFVTPFGENQ